MNFKLLLVAFLAVICLASAARVRVSSEEFENAQEALETLTELTPSEIHEMLAQDNGFGHWLKKAAGTVWKHRSQIAHVASHFI